MSLAALLLVLVAAAMHTGWNFAVKQVADKHVFTWWALVVGALVYLPLLVQGLPIPAWVWPYAIASALLEAAYFMVLIHAYDRGDFSLVYPIARGAAPVFLTVWGALFLGEPPHLIGISGLAVLLIGLLVVGGGSWWVQRWTTSLSAGGVGAAVGVALCISIYSAVDGAAVRLMAPALYSELVFGLTTGLVTPAVLTRYGYHTAVGVWRAHWKGIIAGSASLCC